MAAYNLESTDQSGNDLEGARVLASRPRPWQSAELTVDKEELDNYELSMLTSNS